MQALSRDEILKVLEIASESPRNHAMILLAFRHGLRASEVCELRLSDLDLENGEITVKRLKGSLKTTQALTDLSKQPLLSEQKVLRNYLKSRPQDASDCLFISRKGGQLDRTAFFRVFQNIAERAGLPKSRRHPHCLKHSLAITLLENGVDVRAVKQALGHKSLASTGAYLQISDQQAAKLTTQALQRAF